MLKRVFDAGLAGVALVLTSPVMAIVAVLVRLRLGPPVLFRQLRPGRDGRPFTLLKFRTMTDDRDATGALLPNDQRLTPFGRRLRSTSLDELPELLNVVKGDMSLVGPRPLRMEYLERYSPSQARRHEVRPGITGLAQISGRNALSWEERFELDVWYVDNRTFWLDVSILVRTVAVAVTGRGVHGAEGGTVEPFGGEGEDAEEQGRKRCSGS